MPRFIWFELGSQRSDYFCFIDTAAFPEAAPHTALYLHRVFIVVSVAKLRDTGADQFSESRGLLC